MDQIEKNQPESPIRRRRWFFLVYIAVSWALYLWWPWLQPWYFPAILVGGAVKILIWGPPAPRRALVLSFATIAVCMVVVGMFALLLAATA